MPEAREHLSSIQTGLIMKIYLHLDYNYLFSLPKWVDKLTVDLSEWKARFYKCEAEKKALVTLITINMNFI